MAILIALAPAGVLTAQRLVESSPAPAGRHTSPSDGDEPIPPVSPSASPGVSPSASPGGRTPSPTPSGPTTAVRALPRVPVDAPRRLTAGALIDSGFDNAVTSLAPASTTEVARLESRGSPGSPGTDTVVVIGTVAPGGESALAALAEVRPGSGISLRTDLGTMTYTVRTMARKPTATLLDDTPVSRRRPGWLVLVGIRYDASGDRLADALVVTAELTAAERG